MNTLSPRQFGIRHIPEGHGSDDYESAEGDAYRMELPGGYTDFEHIPDEKRIHVRWMESQRPGTGRGMVDALQRRYPGHDLETGGFTPQGREFNERLDGLIAERGVR